MLGRNCSSERVTELTYECQTYVLCTKPSKRSSRWNYCLESWRNLQCQKSFLAVRPGQIVFLFSSKEEDCSNYRLISLLSVLGMSGWVRWARKTDKRAAKSLQSHPTLCDPIDRSPPDSPIPGILQARTLEWVAISFSNAWKWKVKGKSLSHVWLFATPWTAAHQAPPSIGFSRQEYWSGVPLPSPIKQSDIDFRILYTPMAINVAFSICLFMT